MVLLLEQAEQQQVVEQQLALVLARLELVELEQQAVQEVA